MSFFAEPSSGDNSDPTIVRRTNEEDDAAVLASQGRNPEDRDETGQPDYLVTPHLHVSSADSGPDQGTRDQRVA